MSQIKHMTLTDVERIQRIALMPDSTLRFLKINFNILHIDHKDLHQNAKISILINLGHIKKDDQRFLSKMEQKIYESSLARENLNLYGYYLISKVYFYIKIIHEVEMVNVKFIFCQINQYELAFTDIEIIDIHFNAKYSLEYLNVDTKEFDDNKLFPFLNNKTKSKFLEITESHVKEEIYSQKFRESFQNDIWQFKHDLSVKKQSNNNNQQKNDRINQSLRIQKINKKRNSILLSQSTNKIKEKKIKKLIPINKIEKDTFFKSLESRKGIRKNNKSTDYQKRKQKLFSISIDEIVKYSKRKTNVKPLKLTFKNRRAISQKKQRYKQLSQSWMDRNLTIRSNKFHNEKKDDMLLNEFDRNKSIMERSYNKPKQYNLFFKMKQRAKEKLNK